MQEGYSAKMPNMKRGSHRGMPLFRFVYLSPVAKSEMLSSADRVRSCPVKGIIIAGGLGTRLRPLTYQRPKPLVPVANRPFLEYQVAHLRKYGIDDIVFATNYMADKIESHF